MTTRPRLWPGPMNRATVQTTLAAMFAFAVAALLLPNLAWPTDDAAIFVTVGEGIWRGELPYRDLWDHKPPGIYVAASMGWHVLWLITVLSVTGTGLVFVPLVGPFVALVTVVSLASYPAALGGGHTETLGALPASAALLLGTRQRWAWSGTAAGLALLFSLQYAPLLIALAVLGGRGRLLLGLGAVLICVVGVLAAVGILAAAWDAVVVYGRSYAGLSRSADLKNAWHLGVVVLPLLVAVSFSKDRVDLAMAAWIAAGVMLILLQGRLFGHYATPLVLPLAVLARHPTRGRRLVMAGAIVAAVVLSMVVWRSYPQRGPATEDVGAWIRHNTTAGDRILMWGVDANIYLSADRAPAGRYPYLMPLVTPGYADRAAVDDWVHSLRSDPPEIIVDSEAANAYWVDGEDFLRPPPPGAAGGRDLDIIETFRQFVRERYELVTELYGRKVWRLRS